MPTADCAKCGATFQQTTRGARRKYCDACAPKRRKPVTHVPAHQKEQTNRNPQTTTPAPTNHGVATAATQGRRQLLEALRNTIATQIDDGVPARDLASLSKRLVDISIELDGLVAQEEGDDIAQATSTPDESFTPSGGSQTRPS